MQQAKLIAMKIVMKVPKGAGQHSGPQGVARVTKKTLNKIEQIQS